MKVLGGRDPRWVGLSVLLVVATAIAVPAQAGSPNDVGWWFVEHIPTTETEVRTRGKLTFTFSAGGQREQIVCEVKGYEIIRNPPGREEPGTDQVTRFAATGCRETKRVKSPFCRRGQWSVSARGLPWPSHLEPEYPGVWDVMEGVQLELGCKANTSRFDYHGLVRATVGENVLVFDGTLSEELSSEAHITGEDFMRSTNPPGVKSITAASVCVHLCH